MKNKGCDVCSHELDFVTNKLANNKTPGTDKVISELIKWLGESSRELLLVTIHSVLDKDELEDILERAAVASIYTKADSSNLANYRPISPLQTVFL